MNTQQEINTHRAIKVGHESTAHQVVSQRQEAELREAAARDKADGWVSEFVAAVPYFFLAAVVWLGALVFFHYLEWGTFFTQAAGH